ncbi:hypothetical protein [Erysipelothrix aquatica]|uniref:hypothetical protein n=1 Tax=Erysipelothrix aquatica TaxID=2683714 RepID=UPI001359C26B|nr:hypothetical protein [Erysipelothrix aquatica]
MIEYLHNLPEGTRIYANIKSIKNVEYTYISSFTELLDLSHEHDCVIVYDEIFTALTKSTKMTTEVLAFLSQMRKRRIIFITTAQEWLEINITLRRYCRYQIECNMRGFKFIGLLFKSFYDAEKLRFNKDSMEYEAPLSTMTISKCNLYVANSYDTYEVIAT